MLKRMHDKIKESPVWSQWWEKAQRGTKSELKSLTNIALWPESKQYIGVEDGYHVTFDCPQYRQELIGGVRTWEELDAPRWKKEEEE
ncbi:hypothetical protein EV426DRAFT_706498 [Tirmania nivea]|nr:hypothetical protein EV426DRAFT_706498 [Tirmania nivea]